MNNSYNTEFNNIDANDDFNFQKEVFKYIYYWKYFLISSMLFFLIAYTYLRYSEKIYDTNAKIQIIDKKETALELTTASELFSKSKINLENEIEIIKSNPIINRVIKNLNLRVEIYVIGNIKKALVVDYPFEITVKADLDSLITQTYRLNKTDKGFEIIDYQNESISYYFNGTNSFNDNHDLPFEI